MTPFGCVTAASRLPSSFLVSPYFYAHSKDYVIPSTSILADNTMIDDL